MLLSSSLRRAIPLIFTLGAFWSITASSAQGKASSASDSSAPIDVNFFYDNLKDDGSWYNTTEYGDVWQPYIAYKSDTWRPYTDGYWSYTDGGWMFVSNENFGWAVYHYGRWTRLKDVGWAWVPGTEWAPAWVTWRSSTPDGNGPPPNPDGTTPAAINATSTTATNAPVDAVPDANGNASDAKDAPAPTDSAAPPLPALNSSSDSAPPSKDYVGWAPLPPEPAAAVNLNYAYGPNVDVDYGIDPYDYCFTDVRYFGAPYLASVIFDPFAGYYCCGHSYNITNVYYNGSGGYRGYYAGGPDLNRFRGRTDRAIPQYNLRQTTGAAARNAIRNGQFNGVHGKNLSVPAPKFSHANVAPNGRVNFTHAGTLAKAEVNHGAPASAADNASYKQARESFAHQADTYRAAHPGASGNRGNAEGTSKVVTTPQAQQEERAARANAGENAAHAGATNEPRAGGDHPSTASESKHGEKETRREAGRREEEHAATSRERRTESAGAGRGRGGSPVARTEQRAAPRQVAAPHPQAAGPRPEPGGDKKKK